MKKQKTAVSTLGKQKKGSSRWRSAEETKDSHAEDDEVNKRVDEKRTIKQKKSTHTQKKKKKRAGESKKAQMFAGEETSDVKNEGREKAEAPR